MDDPSSFVSLVPPKLIDGVEAYLVFNKPVLREGTDARAIVIGRKTTGPGELDVTVKLDDGKTYTGKAKTSEEGVFTAEFTIDLPSKKGKHSATLLIGSKEYDRTFFYVEDPSTRDPLYFTFVWHNHQAPNYDPDGKIHSPWAYTYVWGRILSPYGRGPYLYHAEMIKKHPHYRATFNLSPSLLAQWLMLIEKGIEFKGGEKIGPGSDKARLVKETLEYYRDAAVKGRIDVLTSIYAHTIAGFLIDVLGMEDIVMEELRYGKTVTEKSMGENYSPQGAWTPEMAFTMKLVPIYAENNIKYTVLDDLHHFQWAEGDKDSQYEPYILVDKETGKSITVFFRDHELSDILGFLNNYYSPPHAWRNAYETALRVFEKWLRTDAKTLVLALDGENWMVFPRNRSLTAYYLDKLIIYLEALNDDNFIVLSTLREMYDKIPTKRILTHIHTNTWLGTFRKWRGEVREQEEYWLNTAEVYARLKAYEKIIGVEPGGEEHSRKARWSLWHALDSDYWWAEFWKPDVIGEWLGEAGKIVDDRLSKVRIREVRSHKSYIKGVRDSILVVVENQLDMDASLEIRASSIGAEAGVENETFNVKVKRNGSYSRTIPIVFNHLGKKIIAVSILAGDYTIDEKSAEVVVRPGIPPNPV